MSVVPEASYHREVEHHIRLTQSQRKRLNILAAIAVLAVVAMGGISQRATHVMGDTIAALDHTRETLLKADQMRGALAEAESDARGFVITGEGRFRADFDRAAKTLQSSSRELRSLAWFHPRQRRFLLELEPLVAQRIQLLRRLFALDGRRDPVSAAAVHATVVEGERVTRTLYAYLDDLRAEELRRVKVQTATAESARRFAVAAPAVMSVVALAAFVLMLIQGTRTLRSEVALRERLRQAAAVEHGAYRQARDSDQMKDQFLATVSHELRTPLTSIIGWCDILANESVGRDLMDDGVTAINEAARVQLRLVEDLLDVSRIAAGKVRLTLAPVNAVEIVDAAIASMRPLAQEKNIHIRKHVGATPHIILADRQRLQQVICNLLSNGIKFTPPDGTIDVEVGFTGSALQMVVRDNGDGIPADLLPHVFSMFRQGRSAAGRQSGLGLGLAIVKNLVELHGGSVQAHSAGPAKGATFTVRMPVPAAEAAAPHPEIVTQPA